MTPRLRTIAILMLLAGLSLGVFASRALRAWGPSDLAPGTERAAAPRIEQLVDHYQRDYNLTPQDADRVRRALVEYDRAVRTRLLELRQQHAPDFEQLNREVEERIAEILESSR
jgi:hypothetical protein